jgi:predicted MPP superfamily phosphohydrolase
MLLPAWSLFDPPPFALGVVLFAVATVGHLCLVVISHNWWYGGHLPKPFGDVVQMVHGLLFLAGPVALYWWFGLDLGRIADLPNGVWKTGVLSYLLLCCLTGLLGLPAVTLFRRMLLHPSVLASNHMETVDVAGVLGYRPMGSRFYRHLTRLPGNYVFRVDFSEKLLRLPRLSAAWSGLTILHISDLHLNGTPDRKFFEHVMEHCARWQPDIVAITGDIVDDAGHIRWVVPVLGRLKCGIAAFAILGNHDEWYDVSRIRQRVRRSGITMLGNTWIQLDVRGEPMIVIGNETPWFSPGPDLRDCPQAPFRLCLSHTPDNIAWARANGIDLMLAGHVHGGQVRLPLIGSILVPSRYGRRYDCGTFDEPPTVMHVSRGLSGQEPLRYNCRPEVTKLVLQCAG